MFSLINYSLNYILNILLKYTLNIYAVLKKINFMLIIYYDFIKI